MEVVLYRIDERLIHGQVMVAWLGKFGANTVVIADDASAGDEFMQQVYQLAAPSGVQVEVTGCAGLRGLVGDQDGKKAIVLFKDPQSALAALREDVPAGELVVGNVATTPGRKKYTRYAYLSDEEKEMLAMLQGLGWAVNMQLLPDDAKSEFKK